MAKLCGTIFVLIMCSGLSVNCSKPLRQEVKKLIDQKENCGSFGYEVLISKMEYLEEQFGKQQLEIRKQNELILSILRSLQVNSKIDQLGTVLKQALTSLQKNVDEKFLQQESKINEQNDRLKRTLDDLEKADKNILTLVASVGQAVYRKFDKVNDNFGCKVIRSCTLESSKVSGLYLLKPFKNGRPFIGHCEQDKFGGGWLMFQHRFDGSLNFYRDWSDYKAGFGQPNGEFWLGLEQLHQLTKGRSHSLLVEIEDFYGKHGYAMYDGFEVGSEEENYALKVLGKYNGTAGESLRYHKNMNFSTFDNDNDSSKYNCASVTKGAWWYKNCHVSNLNGLYKNEDDSRTNHWFEFKKNRNGLKVTKMMIREN